MGGDGELLQEAALVAWVEAGKEADPVDAEGAAEVEVDGGRPFETGPVSLPGKNVGVVVGERVAVGEHLGACYLHRDRPQESRYDPINPAIPLTHGQGEIGIRVDAPHPDGVGADTHEPGGLPQLVPAALTGVLADHQRVKGAGGCYKGRQKEKQCGKKTGSRGMEDLFYKGNHRFASGGAMQLRTGLHTNSREALIRPRETAPQHARLPPSMSSSPSISGLKYRLPAAMLWIAGTRSRAIEFFTTYPEAPRTEHRLDVDPFAVKGQGHYLHPGQFGADLPGGGNPPRRHPAC